MNIKNKDGSLDLTNNLNPGTRPTLFKPPYHIIEIDCPKCNEDGEGGEYLFPSFKCTGKRLLAAWKHTLKNMTGVNRATYGECKLLVHSMRKASSAEPPTPSTIEFDYFVKKHSPYQSNTKLPNGEHIGEVKLYQAKDFIGLGAKFIISEQDRIKICHKALGLIIPYQPYTDYWLCTALVKEDK